MSSWILPGQPQVRKAMPASMIASSSALRNAEVDDAAGLVEAHVLDAHAAVVDEVARELHAPPLVARRRRQVVHQRALLGEEAEHVAVAAQVDELLHEVSTSCSVSPMPTMMCAPNFCGPKMSRASVQDLPVFRPAVRRRHALAARAVEDLRRRGVERDGEDVGAEILQRSRRRRASWSSDWTGSRPGIVAGSMRSVHCFSTVTVSASERGCVIIEMHMRWNGGRAPSPATMSMMLGHRHRRPVDADEVAVGVVALGLAMARQPAVGAVGAAALGIGEQQVEAARAGAAVHLARHDAERDRRRRRHLHVLGRAHVRRQPVVVRQIDALRRHVGRFDAARRS